MKNISCEADLFIKTTRLEDLAPEYQAYRKHFASPLEWSKANKFFAWCDYHHIPSAAINDQVAADFVAAAVKAGKAFYKHKIEELRALNLDFEGGPVLALSPPKGRSAPRQEQFVGLPEGLKKEFEALRAAATMTAKAESYEVHERLVLRALELAEGLGFKIEKSLAELWSVPVFQALTKACFGVEDVEDWKESKTAIQDRYRLLLIGREYAERVANDLAMVTRIDGYLLAHGAPKGRNMPEAIRAGAKQFEVLGFMATLKDLAFRAMGAFHMSPLCEGHHAAMSSGNMLLQLASGQLSSCIVETAEFAGVPRRIASADTQRPLLILTKTKKSDGEETTEEIKVEEAMAEETRCAFDKFYLGFVAKFGRVPRFLNEQADGSLRSTSAYSVDLKSLGEAIDIALGPQIVRVGVPIALKRAGLSDREIARALGISQDINFHSAFREVLESGTSQEFADELQKADHLKVRGEEKHV